jgi:hypothetical protein
VDELLKAAHCHHCPRHRPPSCALLPLRSSPSGSILGRGGAPPLGRKREVVVGRRNGRGLGSEERGGADWGRKRRGMDCGGEEAAYWVVVHRSRVSPLPGCVGKERRLKRATLAASRWRPHTRLDPDVMDQEPEGMGKKRTITSDG